MGLLSFFRRDASSARHPSLQRGHDSVDLIRARARRRLVGAVVLVLAAVMGLPLLLETQPRPLSADIGKDPRANEVRLADAAPAERSSSASPASASASAAMTNVPSQAVAAAVVGAAVVAGAVAMAPTHRPATAVASAPRPVVATTPSPAPTPPPSAARPAAPVPRPAPTPAARQPAETRPPLKPHAPAPTPAPAPRAEAKPAPAAAPVAGRFAVQVGAFEHAAAARETRSKVERLGMKAYEQEIGVEGARRIRVRLGPFASREEADRTVQKLRASGMTASVMPL